MGQATQDDEAAQRQNDAILANLKRLGEILRQSLVDNNLAPLEVFLLENGILCSPERLEAFRDYLITAHIDVRDLAPQARERLREKTLELENPLLKSADYRDARAAGVTPRCRDCQYFVNAPNDGSEFGDRACTYFGTKGTDRACFGFTRKLLTLRH